MVRNAEPVTIATVGSFSGPVSSIFVPMLQGIQAWVRAVNAQGGVAGRPVRHLVYDDGSDPARHRSQVQEAVEQRRVIAFVGNVEVVAGRGSIDYITAKRVPVIGNETATQWSYENPFYFPQSSSGDQTYVYTIYGAAEAAVPAGKRKLGWLYCAEVQACSEYDRVALETAPRAGFEVAYRSRSSLVQPDFTAECLAARNAGAEVMIVVMDTNSVRRVAASCARQGFRPVYVVGSSLAQDDMKKDPNFDGVIVPSPVVPYFLTGTPALDEFHRATAGIPGLIPGVAPVVGWTAAKLFEKALRNRPDATTSADLLEGLWTIRSDTLGGLTAPLTFVREKPATPQACWFLLKVQDTSWVSVRDAIKCLG